MWIIYNIVEEDGLTGLLVCVTGVELRRTQAGRAG